MVETKVEDLEILSNFRIQIFPSVVQNFGKNLKSNLLIPFLSLTSLSLISLPPPLFSAGEQSSLATRQGISAGVEPRQGSLADRPPTTPALSRRRARHA